MYEIKNRIFLEFTKTQKTAICNFLRALVKKNICFPSPHPSPNSGDGVSLSVEEILEKFLEDERYYLEINSSRFEFLKDFIEEDSFQKEAKLYIKECVKYYEFKKSQEPMIQAQKEFDKKKRRFLQEVKMSKEFPTKKQISYYNSLCKRYSLDKKDVKDLSKLDLKKEIESIINEKTVEHIPID